MPTTITAGISSLHLLWPVCLSTSLPSHHTDSKYEWEVSAWYPFLSFVEKVWQGCRGRPKGCIAWIVVRISCCLKRHARSPTQPNERDLAMLDRCTESIVYVSFALLKLSRQNAIVFEMIESCGCVFSRSDPFEWTKKIHMQTWKNSSIRESLPFSVDVSGRSRELESGGIIDDAAPENERLLDKVVHFQVKITSATNMWFWFWYSYCSVCFTNLRMLCHIA